MGLRSFLDDVGDRNVLTEPVETRFELPALAVQDERRPIVFESVADYPDVRAVSNLVSSRELIGEALGVEPSGIIDAVSTAMDDPLALERERPAAFEHVADEPDVAEHVPIPIYYDEHERQYFASTVVIAKDPETGVHNLSFHRMMYDEGNRLVMRLVERHLHDIYTRTEGGLDVAIVMGVNPAVEIAAATSFSPDMSELELANRLLDGELATTEFHGLTVPSEAELVMGATITDERAEEGPFVDLSRTWDRTRQQPVVEVNELHARPDPLARVIVPGRKEHAHLMGIPQEPRIYRIVENTVPTVENVVLTPGGCSWLHGVVQIDKRTEGDPKNAGMAALAAHPSMKKVTVVDSDVDPADPDAVEWATATRMQPDRDIETIENAKGSSLDPSQDYETGTLTKWIVDATIPGDRERSEFAEVTVPGADELDLSEYQ
ncbi:3-polyprenyl-4-hydroxybenzoate decarboxylase or related decarboxylase [Halapricum desulfuricans]|uniref:Anhydromevalonate phosphate decarboxylase n=1 Tax=Halapricum desulfuricans TaxID=2841257 RepID=A0A897NK49_9EURY|nr:UbiD family decarboxylase [Halapricum desulfuricans]QSG12814.1 3-polyprenyl-4-hydroxybenzoate decarboxylase or related decarboxylase [Halapricum desulfuricans]